MKAYKITASGKSFNDAVKFCKKCGGTFDPASKTWTMNEVDAGTCKLFGLAPVAGRPSEVEMYKDWSENEGSSL